MALDTLQLSPVVLNTDKIAQAAGSLMAKQQAESIARRKSMTDDLSKIDSSKIRSADLVEFRKMYDDLLSFGSENMNKMNDIEVQSELNRKMNRLRGFADLSARAKEEYDVPLIKRKYDEDIDPNSAIYIDSVLTTPTSKLSSVDMSKITNVDRKDYLTEFFSGFKGSVEKELGNKIYKNTPETYGEIKDKAEAYIESSLTTPTGSKSFSQFVKGTGADISTQEGKEKALKDFSDALFTNFIARADVSTKEDEAKKPSEFDMTMSLGFSPTRIPFLKERLNFIDGIYQSNPNTLSEIKRYLPEGSKAELAGANGEMLKIRVPEELNDGTRTGKILTYAYNKNDKDGFVRGINSLLSTFGTKRGYQSISNEEIGAFAKSVNYSPKFNPKRIPSNAPQKKASVSTNAKQTDVSSLFNKK